MQKNLKTIKCTITYMGNGCPKENGWFFAYARTRFEKIAIRGITNFELKTGMDVILKAEEKDDGSYWVNAENIQLNPANRRQVINYLSGTDFPGIGLTIAEKLYDTYGTDVFDIIRDHSDRLKSELNLTKKQILSLRDGCLDIKSYIKSRFPQIPMSVIKKIIDNVTGDPRIAIREIEKDPYLFINTIPGYTFKIADDIAINALHIPKNNWDRLGHVLSYTLEEQLQSTGHNYIPMDDPSWFQYLKYKFDEYAGVSGTPQQFSAILSEQGRNYIVIEENGRHYLYTRKGWWAENNILDAVKIAKTCCCNYTSPSLTAKDVADRVRQLKQQPDASIMDIEQAQSLCTSLSVGISIITGGPGRGKSSAAKWLCDLWEKQHPKQPVSLFAPTGRAAKNLKDKTGRKANTIARLCVMSNFILDEHRKRRRKLCPGEMIQTGPLEFIYQGLAIIDEASMIGTEAMGTALDILINTFHMQVIIMGDPDQLPPIEYGCPFRDMIASGKIPVSRLTTCHRADIKIIADNGDKIAAGDTALDWNDKFQMLTFPDEETLKQAITMNYYALMGVNPLSPTMPNSKQFAKVLLLAAKNKGPAGIRSLNLSIQDTLNPAKQQCQATFYVDDPNIKNPNRFTGTLGFEIPGTYYAGSNGASSKFRIGDRVVCTKNNPDVEIAYYKNNDLNNSDVILDRDYGVNNGDCGTIVRYYEPKYKTPARITIQLDNKGFVTFPLPSDEKFNLDLTLAYALTVHKAQGSEAETVLFSMQHSLYHMPKDSDFASRNLVNTGVTRAKKSVKIMGSKDALNRCINTEIGVRFSRLPQRLPN